MALSKAFDLVDLNDRKIFVIIDEYDHFANNLIAMGNSIGSPLQVRRDNTWLPVDKICRNRK
jgi:hypothetical protein